MENNQGPITLDDIEATLNVHRNYLRQLALDIILLEDDDINKRLFEYIQVMGEFERLVEMTALTMKLHRQNNHPHT